MQELTHIREKQQDLVADYVAQMKDLLEQMGVDGGQMSEVSLRGILNKFQERFMVKVGVTGNSETVATDIINEVVENGWTYMVHFYREVLACSS
jgi:hypothetical protein